MLECNGKIQQFKPSAKGKWEVLVFLDDAGQHRRSDSNYGRIREGKNVFRNND